MRRLTSGGGFPAIWYALKKARQSGGIIKFLRALSTKNACKTCALGMGGQLGGMVDESHRFPEICKKSMQAMAADMQGRIQPEFFSTYSLDQLSAFSPRELEHMGRLADPVYAGPGDTHYRVITWDEALSRAIDQFKRTPPDESFFYVSGRSSNEAGFLIQLFARLYGTNNVNNCSYYCHQASGVGLTAALGTGTATIALEDLEHCDLVFLIGANPASNHPRLMRQLMNLRCRGGEIIVINPLRETGLVNFAVPSDLRSLFFGSPIATEYVQPHIGGDLALLTGIAKQLLETEPRASARAMARLSNGVAKTANAVSYDFITSCTDGFQDFATTIRSISWDNIVHSSGVNHTTISRIAELYAKSERAIFAWTMGITHHAHGTDNVRAIVNLALLRGMVGKAGAGLLPIRGHSNVQGIGSVGVTPALKQAVFDRLQNHFGVKLPTAPGLDTLACIDAMHAGRIRTGICLGGNLFGASPDARRTHDAFAKLDFVAYMSTSLNTGHAWGRGRETLILPVLARDEEPQPTTQESMFSYVRMSDGGPRRFDGPRSEVEVLAALALGVLGENSPIDWSAMQQHRRIREAIARIVPGFEKIGAIDDTRREFQITGRTFHEPHFPTATGRAQFHVPTIPARNLETNELCLMTLRSEGQFNTVVYEDEDIYRGQERRDVILMHVDDINRLGLREDQPVRVKSAVGEMRRILVRPFDIRPGNAAMYYPESNILVAPIADPQSRTPAFKSVPITVTPDDGSNFVQLSRSDSPARSSSRQSRLNAC